MSTRVAITHRIEQRFERSVRLSTHWLRLRPAPYARARITAYSLVLHAEPHYINWVRDPFENHLARVDLPEPLAALSLDVELIAEFEPVNPLDFLIEPYAVRHPFVYPVQLRKELGPYLHVPDCGPRLEGWLSALAAGESGTVERVTAVNQRVHALYSSEVPMVPGAVDLETVLARGAGSAWDLAWLLTLGLRHLGLGARCTCGYLVLLAEQGQGTDSVALSAWTEVYLPGAGWIGIDPVTGLFTAERHIPLASAPDPLRVAPIVGYREACEESRREALRIRRLVPERPSWPYTETQWCDIQALGCLVDRDLAAQGLRAGIGAVLSLVSEDHETAPEWRLTALGPSKREAAESLCWRLRERLAPGGVVQIGQGEWYSGDALPRWRLSCLFRADGRPVWHNRALLGCGARDEGPSPGDARRFAHTLARVLGLEAAAVLAAHEDILHAMSESRSPLDYMPAPEDLRDPGRRRVLAQRLSQSRGEPAGYVLPLRWDAARARWATGRWTFRRDALYLLPGDSALGYRLPLGSLVDDEEGDREAQIERCQFEERGPLAERYGEVSARLSRVDPPPGEPSSPADAGGVTPHTALCVELRGGHLYCFLPPLSQLEHYLDLVASIEAVAEAEGMAVTLEGYEPAEDYRLQRIVLEPEAGVLRVTLPQVHSWQAQLPVLEAVYEEAGRLGLRGERILPGGQRLPTGGGSQLSVGGVRPVDSPLLRRPQLLRALVAYWQRHPSLSYFFAGQDIGPGGPAPRPDEGREESLYELSIALERLPEGETDAPWEADRILRHLLTGPAGDLRRAEIRTDELYAPERASKRLGRIWIQGFETAPHVSLASLQTLLVMGLLGRLARRPEPLGLVRWGTALHDRFMLPDVLWEDLDRVVQDLDAVGYPFQLEWFRPLMTLRFPVLGVVQTGEISLELRMAHEPWPLSAEEVTAGGVVQFIDTANERVQVKLSGLAPGRYVLVCNGHPVPLHGAGLHDQYVAGVRYKIASPPATQHPTVAPVEALVFDLVDTWSGRVIGGCTYLPARPEIPGPIGAPAGAPVTGGGRGPVGATLRPPRPPVSRSVRGPIGRFVPEGSGRVPMSPPGERIDRRASYLLDLTRVPRQV